MYEHIFIKYISPGVLLVNMLVTHPISIKTTTSIKSWGRLLPVQELFSFLSRERLAAKVSIIYR